MDSDPLLSVQVLELARHNGFAKPIIRCIVEWVFLHPLFTLRVVEVATGPGHDVGRVCRSLSFICVRLGRFVSPGLFFSLL